MPPPVDIKGKRFGMLVAVHRKPGGWLCKCDCGKMNVVQTGCLRNGSTKSCGCRKGNRRHGHSGHNRRTPEYGSWRAMLDRCRNAKTVGYRLYGGRGIKVCRRWYKFTNFLKDVGRRPAGRFLDRIDPDGNYEPENVRWSTRSEQNRNRRVWKLKHKRP